MSDQFNAISNDSLNIISVASTYDLKDHVRLAEVKTYKRREEKMEKVVLVSIYCFMRKTKIIRMTS